MAHRNRRKKKAGLKALSESDTQDPTPSEGIKPYIPNLRASKKALSCLSSRSFEARLDSDSVKDV